jgi:hypothetical protein
MILADSKEKNARTLNAQAQQRFGADDTCWDFDPPPPPPFFTMDFFPS